MEEKATGALHRVPEAAKLWNVKASTVYRWVFDGRIKPVRIGTRAVRIPQSEIERIIFEGQRDRVTG